jgi:exonuclease VII small subunit
MSRINSLIDELEQTAARLRSGELDGDAAADAVERCAQLATELGSELDLHARAATATEPPGQEKLL